MKPWIPVAVAVLLVAGVSGWLWGSGTTNPPCDDGDPCTIDRLRPVSGQCIHVPDAMCQKPCKDAAECAYPKDVAPCLSASCHKGMCRYMEIAKDECQRCGAASDCSSAFCDPRECIEGFCRKTSRDCDDKNPNTWDVCDAKKSACRHYSGDGLEECNADADCQLDHPCQKMRCQDGRCWVSAETVGCDPYTEPRQCKRNQDCIQRVGGKCIAGPCEKGWCRWRDVPNSRDCKPCTGDHDCQDSGSYCQWPICTGTVCTVETVPFCQDMDPDTRDECSNDLQACVHPHNKTPPKCQRAPDDDGNAKTVDFCDPRTGEEHHLPAAEGDCATENKCWYTYRGPDGFCLGHEIVCLHDDACAAHCDPDKGCVLDAQKDCHCRSDDECGMDSPCARVFCIDPGPNGACWGTFIDDCVPCKDDVDCRMDDWCVSGECSAEGYCQYYDKVTCDDGDPNTFGFCHGQRDDPCTYERIYEY